MNDNKIPVWFWILAGIALLWNVMGLYAFYTDMTITPEGIAALPADERGLYENEPCLLYTSPSPRDKRQSRMPSSA